jgi:alkanesulfonate monooxygenase SsuD/methylene tetrahydromethanopterin reductase-like flavin-dependent oxidoreductase (luciferase family)
VIVRLGIGLPTHFGNLVTRAQLLEWARRAESAGFHSLVVHDRPNHETWDPLATLAAVAATTDRARLVTAALLLPPRDEALVAKQAAVVDVVSGGRLELGLALGARADDYELFGHPFTGRGQRFEEQLERLRLLWAQALASAGSGVGVGPAPIQRPHPPLWIGGYSDAAVDRAVRVGYGYLFGAPSAAYMAERVPRIRSAAARASRTDLRIAGLAYVLPTSDGTELARAERLLRRYYTSLRRPFAEMVISGSRVDVVDRVRAYEEAGLDILHLLPVTTDPAVVDTLAAWLLPAFDSAPE